MEPITGITVDPNGAAEKVTLRSLDDMQRAVGGYIEPVTSLILPVQGYVNEDGLMLRLAPNRWATAFFGRRIVGSALIVGAAHGANDMSLSSEHLGLILESISTWYATDGKV